jgi:hypothetical protein
MELKIARRRSEGPAQGAGRPGPGIWLIVCALAWIAAWAAMFGLDGRRAHIGRLGALEWAPRARDARLPDADRAVAAVNARFESRVADAAERRQRTALLLAVSGPLCLGGATALWHGLRAREPTGP